MGVRLSDSYIRLGLRWSRTAVALSLFVAAQDALAQQINTGTPPPVDHRALADQILAELRNLDSAVEQFATEANKHTGDRVAPAELRKYLKKGSRLETAFSASTGFTDPFGNPYGPLVVDQHPKVHPSTFRALSDVADETFWAQYTDLYKAQPSTAPSAVPTPIADSSFCVLDLRGESNLKTLFDAGLRPRRERGLGSQCEVFNQRITFLVAPNFRFPLIADNVRFTLLEDGRIAEAVAKGANLRWEAARATAAGLFGIAGSVPPDLDKALGVLKNGSFELLRDIGVRVPGEPETHVTFMPGDFVPTDPTNQYVRVALRFYWKERMQHGKLRQAPLTPPAGYEAESMEPLPFDVSSKEPQ